MKRLFIMIAILLLLSPLSVNAAELSVFDEQIEGIEESLPQGTSDDLNALGIGSVDDILSNGIDTASVMIGIGNLLRRYMNTPLSVLVMLIAVILLTAAAESYAYSLRYTETREIMGVASSLFIAASVVAPVADLITSSVAVIQAAASLMLLYLPVMAGMLAFSGHLAATAGYYTAVTAVSQWIAWLSGTALAPLLRLFLSLSVSAGVCPRLNLSGLTDMAAKGFKWLLTFATAIFTAVIGMNGALASAGDSVASKAAKFTLSSFVPLIGSAIAEAYQTIRGSVHLLRSGLGVFVILSVAVTFAPLIIKAILWSLALYFARLTQEAFSVTATASVLNALSSFTAAIRAMLIAVMTAFLISSAVMLSIGGAS